MCVCARAQHFLAVLRTAKVDTLTLRSTGTDAPRLSIHLLCSKSGTHRHTHLFCAVLRTRSSSPTTLTHRTQA